MKHLLAVTLALAFSTTGIAQWQINPQLGATFQQITKAPNGITYAARAGIIGGVDFRFGDRLFVQPGAFIGRNATYFQVADSAVSSGKLFRTNLKLKLQGGYRVLDSYQFDIRISLGPSFEYVLDRNVKDTDIELNNDDYNDGLWSIDGAVGFDIGRFTLEPSVSAGLSRIYNDDVNVQNIGSRYVTYAFTLGVNIGDEDKEDLPPTP